MYCSSCGTSNREGAKFCHRCGSALFKDERLRQLDLCFVMDATGSMRDHIDAARKNLQTLARKLTAHPLHPDMAYALVLYRDHADPGKDSGPVTELSPFSLYLADLQQALMRRAQRAVAAMARKPSPTVSTTPAIACNGANIRTR